MVSFLNSFSKRRKHKISSLVSESQRSTLRKICQECIITKCSFVFFVSLTQGIPAVIVGLIAAIRPSTFDMGKVQYEDITCGSLNFSAEVQRTRYDLKVPKYY